MTKKHFEAMAHTTKLMLNVARSTEERQGVESLAVALCADFKAANRQFDKDRFLAACGINTD